MLTIIAGISQDSAFNYVCFIAENLSQLLPNFSTQKITISSSDWKDWLKNACKEHGWSHTNTPLIWRETGVYGGDSIYIGGNSEFQKFINTYYGIDVVLSKSEQKALDYDYLLAENIRLSNESEGSKSNVLHVTVSGAGRSVCPDLVVQLSTMKEICEDGIEINLYDTPGHLFKIKDIVKDAIAIGGQLCSVKILENLSDGLQNCDVLIILDHIAREDQESTESWLSRNYEAIKDLAEQINLCAPTEMKVIFCSMGPACFCANVMVKEAHKINKNNIVVVSAHYGLEMIYGFMKSLEIDFKGIGCPPVWGFLGINQYVDVLRMIQKCSVHIPNKRAITSHVNTTLPLGIKYTEFRWLLYLTFDKKPHEILATRKSVCLYQVGRTEDFQKCKAICDLLKLWYQKNDTVIGDEIITLGISSDGIIINLKFTIAQSSNGSFNIPKDIFFSQPVHLKAIDDNSRVWVPCTEFPLPSGFSLIILKNCIDTAELILRDMNLLN